MQYVDLWSKLLVIDIIYTNKVKIDEVNRKIIIIVEDILQTIRHSKDVGVNPAK